LKIFKITKFRIKKGGKKNDIRSKQAESSRNCRNIPIAGAHSTEGFSLFGAIGIGDNSASGGVLLLWSEFVYNNDYLSDPWADSHSSLLCAYSRAADEIFLLFRGDF